jgi:hypothetical protein
VKTTITSMEGGKLESRRKDRRAENIQSTMKES